MLCSADVPDDGSKVFLVVFLCTLLHHCQVAWAMGGVATDVLEGVVCFLFLIPQANEFVMDVRDGGAVERGRVWGSEVFVEKGRLFADGGLDATNLETCFMESRGEGMEFIVVAAEFFGC